MAGIYIPKGSVLEYLKGLLFGFYLDLNEDGEPVLLIKLEASLLVSIINGCQMTLTVRNPNITKRSSTLYIFDTPHNPFYVTWRDFGEPNPVVKDIDDAVYKLATNTKTIKLVLYNELAHPILTTNIKVESSADKFHSWLFKVYNNAEYKEIEEDKEGAYFPESETKGFDIGLSNTDHSKEDMLLILAPEYTDGDRKNPESSLGAFRYTDYQDHGKHGSLQELSITNILYRVLKKDEFFVSPQNFDETEFTDFIILNKNAAIIIESKYVISFKTTKKQSALTKAIYQLNRTEEAILNKTFKLLDVALEQKLQRVNLVIKLCVINDRIVLTDENCKAISAKYSKTELPIFISNTGLAEMLGGLYLKNRSHISTNLFANFIRLYGTYLDDEEETILYRRDFSIDEV